MEHTERHGHCWSLRRRAQAILILAQGRTPAEAATLLQTRRECIYTWRRNWQEKGFGGLAEGRHIGRPGMLGEEQLRYLAESADQGAYTAPQLWALLQARWPEVTLPPASLRRVLRLQGFCW